MSATSIKIRLRESAREIEIEASRAEAEELLGKWSPRLSAVDENRGSSPPATHRSHTSANPSTSRSTDDPSAFDANALANGIKEHSAFDKIEKKIIHVASDPYHKVAVALWVSDRPLTSGQIQAVLGSLQIKIALSSVSTVLERNLGNFLTSGPRRVGGVPPTYQLTAKAKADFEHWLQLDG